MPNIFGYELLFLDKLHFDTVSVIKISITAKVEVGNHLCNNANTQVTYLSPIIP